MSGQVPYDREMLVWVLVYHQRRDFTSCICGWAVLGASHPEHIANMYEQSIKLGRVVKENLDAVQGRQK